MISFLFVELGSLTTANLMEKVRGLQNLAYQLGLEECEYTRNTHLNQWLILKANNLEKEPCKCSSYLMSPLDGGRGFYYMLASYCFLVRFSRSKNTPAAIVYLCE